LEDLEQAAKREAAYQILALTEPEKPLFSGSHYRVIPATELNVRAIYEMDKDHVTFVDCLTARVTPWDCQEALLTLSVLEFSRLVAVGLPRRRTSGYCDTLSAVLPVPGGAANAVW
jgi:Txe/YoeB family toxin of Txe-Axe toxin-antitoxin module